MSETTTIFLELTNVTKENLQTLAAKQVQIWNDTNEETRLVLMKEIYQDNVSFFDHESVVNGVVDLNGRINSLQHNNVNFKFSLIKIDNNNNVVRYYWNYGPASNPELIAGMDLIILKNGKIRSLHVFLDRRPS